MSSTCRTSFVAVTLFVTVCAVGAQGPLPPPYPPRGRLIDIGGWQLHLNCTGPSVTGQPTVVLEAGVGDFSVEWALLQPRVSGFARVCSYDRAGDGWSDMGPMPRTMRQITFELHTLLEKAAIPPPYVLVGQSYGGVLVRLFATTYPADVAGVVLVDGGRINPLRFVNGKLVNLPDTAVGNSVPPADTSNPLRDADIPTDVRSQIEAAGRRAAATANEAPRDKLPEEAQRMRTWAIGQVKHYVANGPGALELEAEELALMVADERKSPQPLGSKPLIVLTPGRPEYPPDQQALDDDRLKMQAALINLSRNAKQIVVPNSGHHIHIEEPDLVSAAIREVLDSAVTASPLK